MESTIQAIVELLQETGHAHHQAFLATDGADPDWAIWYTDYLYEKLPVYLGTQLDRSELVYAFKRLDYEIRMFFPNTPWPRFYAQELISRYSSSSLQKTTNQLPYISTAQIIEVDRAMIEDYHIELIQMMENAGRNLAHLSRTRFLMGDPRGKQVIVLAGTGGNGGGALVGARRLHNYGAMVRVYVTQPIEAFTPIPKHQYDILERMGVSIALAEQISAQEKPHLIIDGVIGYSLKGAPYGSAATLIEWANQSGAPILALDAPSGLDTTTGTVFEPAIKATATMTLALPKAGLNMPYVKDHVGELYLADISVPPQLYAGEKLGLSIGALFAENDIIRLA